MRANRCYSPPYDVRQEITLTENRTDLGTRADRKKSKMTRGFVKNISVTYYGSLSNGLLSHFEKFDDVLHSRG